MFDDDTDAYEAARGNPDLIADILTDASYSDLRSAIERMASRGSERGKLKELREILERVS